MTYLDTEVSSIHVIPQEQVSRLSRVTTNFKQFHEIEILPVDISTYGYGSVHLQEVGLGSENLRTGFDDP